METNSTSKPPVDHSRNIFDSTLFIASGFPSALFNFFLSITILRYQALIKRKEYIMLCGLSTADFLGGIATTCDGIYRLILIKLDLYYAPINRGMCLFLPQKIVYQISDPTTALMLLAINVDRVISVALPERYYALKAQYAKRFVSGVYLVGISHLIIGFIYPISTWDTEVPMKCSTSRVLYRPGFTFMTFFASFVSFSSVVVYGLAVALYIGHSNRVGAENADADSLKREKKLQRKMTVSLGISSFCTLMLDSLPRAVGIYIYNFNGTFDVLGFSELGRYFWLVIKFNAMANFFIFGMRHKELRFALEAMSKCKTLPNTLGNWNMTMNKSTQGQATTRAQA